MEEQIQQKIYIWLCKEFIRWAYRIRIRRVPGAVCQIRDGRIYNGSEHWTAMGSSCQWKVEGLEAHCSHWCKSVLESQSVCSGRLKNFNGKPEWTGDQHQPTVKTESSPKERGDTSVFFLFLFYPTYKPIGWYHSHLKSVFLLQFVGLHVNHP